MYLLLELLRIKFLLLCFPPDTDCKESMPIDTVRMQNSAFIQLCSLYHFVILCNINHGCR
jgi:hypothetical protein